MKQFHKGTNEHDQVAKSELSHTIQRPEQETSLSYFDKCLSSEKVPILFSIEEQPYCKSFSESAAHLRTISSVVFI